ncbi:unnamed protein product, partial [Prorocentrum cordatum]
PYPFSPAYSYKETGGAKPQLRGTVFRGIEQDGYVKIVALRGDKAAAEWRKWGFMPPLPPAVTRTCWKCGSRMDKKSFQGVKSVFRCSRTSCRKWHNGETAFAPLHGAKVMTHEQYLRISYCFSLQCRVDQTEFLTGASEDMVSRVFACHRDVFAWFMEELGRGMCFNAAEVDMDASKTHVRRRLRGKESDLNIHSGRIWFFKERSTGRRKAGDAFPPEPLADIEGAVLSSLRSGAIACADGGLAIKSAVAKAGVPLATALHGRRPNGQFCRLQLLDKNSVSPALAQVLTGMGTMSGPSASIRVTGGNQAAEGARGNSRSGMQGRAVHRGQAAKHSSAHGMCSLFLSHNPGMAKLGAAHAHFIRSHMNDVTPSSFFGRSGWSGSKGAIGVLAASPAAVAKARAGQKPSAGAAGQEDVAEGARGHDAVARRCGGAPPGQEDAPGRCSQEEARRGRRRQRRQEGSEEHLGLAVRLPV